jgi:multidrug resistance efflux pump
MTMDPTDARAQLREALQERAELKATRRQLRAQKFELKIQEWRCRARLAWLGVCMGALRILIPR